MPAEGSRPVSWKLQRCLPLLVLLIVQEMILPTPRLFDRVVLLRLLPAPEQVRSVGLKAAHLPGDQQISGQDGLQLAIACEAVMVSRIWQHHHRLTTWHDALAQSKRLRGSERSLYIHARRFGLLLAFAHFCSLARYVSVTSWCRALRRSFTPAM